MSKKKLTYKDWEKKYYPVPASHAKFMTKLGAVQHSLTKWLGLRKEVLDRYGLIAVRGAVRPTDIFDDDSRIEESTLYIDDTSCALCVKYQQPELVFQECETCPLYEVRGGARCDRVSPHGVSPYYSFTTYGDPKPMIEWLKKAKQMVEKQNKADLVEIKNLTK